MASALNELEAVLRTPPPSWENAVAAQNNPMATAHAALEYLRETGDENFLFLRTILELTNPASSSGLHNNARYEEHLFHCLTGCRQVLIWQYKTKFSPTFLHTARDFFMMLGVHATSLYSRTIQIACFTSSVSLWKKEWTSFFDTPTNNTSSDIPERQPSSQEAALIHSMHQTLAGTQIPQLRNPDDLFAFLDTLLQSQRYLEAARFLQALVCEFGSRSAVSYRSPLEFHKKAHRVFEKEGALTKSLQLSLHALGKVLTQLAEKKFASAISNQEAGIASAVVQTTMDCMNWEFGLVAWDTGKLGSAFATAGRSSLRPPVEWKTVLVPMPIVQALVHVLLVQQSGNNNDENVSNEQQQLSSDLRQLLLMMSTLAGPLFKDSEHKKQYAVVLVEGTLELMKNVTIQYENSRLIDTLQVLSRLVANFRLSILSEIPALSNLLQVFASVGQSLMQDQIRDCEQAQGDVDGMELRDWREEVLAVLVESAVLLASDPWLLYSGTETSRRQAQKHLASIILGPLYEGMVRCRTRMGALEEHYLVSNGTELDEAKEDILAHTLDEEIEAISTVGRLNLETALHCLSQLHSETMPRLQSLWEGKGEVTADTAALLEEARLLTMYVSQLLTDLNEGETPTVPMAVMQACEEQPSLAENIASAVMALLQFAEAQMHKIALDPNNRRLSPILAKTFLHFLQRWAPAYIFPNDYSSSNTTNTILLYWSQEEKANQAATCCLTLCLYYQCYWPQERQVQEEAVRLLMLLVRRARLRKTVVASPVFVEIVKYHCITAGIRHSASESEFENAVRSKLGDDAMTRWAFVRGYQRLPYQDKGLILSAILVGSCDSSNQAASMLFNDALKAVHDAFVSLTTALDSAAIGHDDINAKEMTCLCLEMLYGVTGASEMIDAERIPQFLTPYLPKLATFMSRYAADLTLCERLLQLFQNYAAQFIAILTTEQSLVMFQASAELLKCYSKEHCSNRVITKSGAETEAEEEQAYSDILCAIQLLINLGAKDFIDACSTSDEAGVGTSQVTDMIFFGLQQLLPLMTQGLLQFPTLCTQFFELVGFMMETYPEKVCQLPFELFNSLIQALLFGMSHHDMNVAKCSLHGIGGIAREHLESKALDPILAQHPDLLDQCILRLFSEVIFRSVVTDRMEAAGMALLPLAAANLPRLGPTLAHMCQMHPQHQERLQQALTNLLTQERLGKVSLTGYQGRMNRVLFKEAFQHFVNEVQSFLVLR